MGAPAKWTLDQLRRGVGEQLGRSDWYEMTQERIDAFAEITGDTQWIHTDPARAAAESPFHAAVAHGFLTLSLLSPLGRDAYVIADDYKMIVNYGLNRVRFPAPVKAGARVRGVFRLEAFEEADWGAQLTVAATVEAEHGDKPCLVAEWIVRAYR